MPKIIFTVEDLLVECVALKAKNRFTPGFDKMTADAAETWIKINGESICKQLNTGKYNVMPAIGFNVAKSNGQYRRLARLTALDTIIQTATIDKISNYCNDRFSEYSFAYQRGKGTGTALQQFCEYATNYPYTAKIDPKACFDNLDYSVLEESLNSFFL